MNKSNKYKIQFKYYKDNITWGMAIKKLDIICFYHPTTRDHNIIRFIDRKFWNNLNNFIIEPDLIHMLKSKDNLSYQTAFEILNTRLLEKLKKYESV